MLLNVSRRVSIYGKSPRGTEVLPLPHPLELRAKTPYITWDKYPHIRDNKLHTYHLCVCLSLTSALPYLMHIIHCSLQLRLPSEVLLIPVLAVLYFPRGDSASLCFSSWSGFTLLRFHFKHLHRGRTAGLVSHQEQTLTLSLTGAAGRSLLPSPNPPFPFLN